MGNTQIIGYVRVSTPAQNIERQLRILEPYHPDKIFSEYASGGTKERPELIKMREYVREGDCVVVPSMDRLGRNFIEFFSIVKEIQDKGASIRFIQEGMLLNPKSPNPMDNLLMGVFAAVAEYERSMIRERQKEGIAIARERGVYKGRKPIDPKRLEKGKEWVEIGLSITKAAKKIGVGRSTLWRYLKDQKEQKGSTEETNNSCAA